MGIDPKLSLKNKINLKLLKVCYQHWIADRSVLQTWTRQIDVFMLKNTHEYTMMLEVIKFPNRDSEM
ncbi:hypothetical protein BKI52_25350 [marine bacterium AO1-C]|nr:hypothetical protein BKI52_25350 [marine bacterium AO1-C]